MSSRACRNARVIAASAAPNRWAGTTTEIVSSTPDGSRTAIAAAQIPSVASSKS